MKIIGHRGAAGLAPENTIAALKKGLEHHADMLEFDLRVTKDGIVILHHDADLTDPNGEKHLIADTDYVRLKEHKPDLATFEEALAAVGKAMPLYVEVKKGERIKPIAAIIKEALEKGRRPEGFWLGSKSQKTLLELNAALPEIPKVVIEPWSGVRAHFRARQVDTTLVCMNQRWLWWGFIRGFKNNEWELYAYTLNDVAKAQRWEKYGLAGVVTDYPDLYQSSNLLK